MAYLRVLKGAPSGNIHLDKDRTVLGRSVNCDIVFPADNFAVSREHACIVRAQDKFFVEDLGSRNGTHVNQQKIATRTALRDNDRIQICDFVYSFQDGTAANRPPLPPELRRDQEPEEPEEGQQNIEATITSSSSRFLLETQPADKLKVLIDISNNLGRTLEMDQLLPKILENLFQLFKQADRGFVILQEESADAKKPGERLIPKAVKTRRQGEETTTRFSRSIVRECLKTAQAFLSANAAEDQRFNMAQSVADFRIRSVMCAPLCVQDGKPLGVIQLDTQDRVKRFTQEDLNLLLAVANQAAVALENARLHETLLVRERTQRDLELAHQVQMGFLPKKLPDVPGYSFYAFYQAAQEVGGDYYGFIPVSAPSARLGVLLGDVAGKGVAASLLMAKLASDARYCLLAHPEPAKCIGLLNDSLCPHTSQMDRFVTLAAAVLDPGTHAVTLVNAGQLAPVLVRREGEPTEATTNQVTGLPLGIMEGFTYESQEVQLEPGDCLLLFSDGVTDSMDRQNKPFDMKGVYAALRGVERTPKALGERVVEAVKRHSTGRSQHDDITLVSFGRTPG